MANECNNKSFSNILGTECTTKVRLHGERNFRSDECLQKPINYNKNTVNNINEKHFGKYIAMCTCISCSHCHKASRCIYSTVMDHIHDVPVKENEPPVDKPQKLRQFDDCY